MNLPDLERLVRKITETLRQPALESQAAALAKEYTDECAAASRRLAQCAAMLFDGHDNRQGLQLAEAHPPLLDWITALAFRQAAEWRAFCQERGLPTPDDFDAKAVKRLNAAYRQGIKADHRLYKEYRRAIQRNEPEAAVVVLRLIASLNAGEKQLAWDLQQLEERVLQLRMKRLRAALQAGDPGPLLEAISEVEALPNPPPPDDELWRQSQQARCRLCLEQITPLRPHRAWREAARWLAEIQAVCARQQVELGPADTAALTQAETWVAECRSAHLASENFRRTLSDVESLLESAEEKQSSTRSFSAADLRRDHERLAKKWRELGNFGCKVPEGLVGRVERNLLVLHQQIVRRQKTKRRLLTLGAAVLVIATVAGGAVVLAHRAARDHASDLSKLSAGRHVLAAEKLLAQLHQSGNRLTNSTTLRAALAQATAMIAAERQSFSEFLQVAERLKAELDGALANGRVEWIQKQFEAATNRVAALSPDFQPEARSGLAAWQARWERFLDLKRQAAEQEFEQRLRATEALASNGLKYHRGPNAVGEALDAMQPLIREMGALSQAPLPLLQFRPELTQSFDSIKARAAAFTREVEQWKSISAALGVPTTLESHLTTLQLIQKSEFATPAQVRAAARMGAVNVSTGVLFSALLSLDKAREWPGRPLQFFPDEPLAPERERFAVVRDDPNFLTVSHCVMTQLNATTLVPVGLRPVWIRGDLTTNKAGVLMAIMHDPFDSPDALSFQERQIKWYDFRFTGLAVTKERRLFERTGLRDFYDANGQYRLGLLQALDWVNEDTESSPVFRAWFATKLHAIIEIRPEDWGAPWAPALAVHRRQLRALGADRISSGAWMVPERERLFARPMEEHFQKARTVSYFRQANFFSRLNAGAVEMGFTFAGYVGENGKVVLVSRLSADELWGWAAEELAPALLIRNGQPVAGRASMIYTPLFAPRGSRRGVLLKAVTEAGLKSMDADEARPLPLLFSEPL